MLKKTVLCLSLLTSYAYAAPLQLESELLSVIDGTIVGWDAIVTMKQYLHKIKHFLKQEWGEGKYKILDLALREKKETITEQEKLMFPEVLKEFVQFSEPFLDALHPVKQGIAPLILESCQRRNRAQSLLVVWTHTEDNAEKETFKKHIKTYRALGELCLDLLNFIDDLLHSCPNAVKAYQDFFERFSAIEPLVDALLAADRVEISHKGALYYDLVRYVAERYTHDEEITSDKTTRLYNSYNIKKRI